MPARQFPTAVLALGATSAIAEATLRLFAERGARFFLVARSQDKLDSVAADLLTRGASGVATHVMDLDDTAAHPALLAAAAQSLGTIEMALLAHGILGDQAEA
ncbi:MAG: SDR family NAD(P)-dependent oxidoreductase, partial [Silvibacterium sp.]